MDDKPIVKPMKSSGKLPFVIGAAIVIILIGLGVGWVVSSKKIASTVNQPKTSSITVSQNEAGVKDLSNYKDTATGILQKGGIKGEGTYHIDREGGPTHTVYLNSTVVDMSTFVGKKVQVWGQTQASQNAPWLMDVGKIQVVQ
jgi:hypothetical protein